MATHTTESKASLDVAAELVRVDQLIDSRHKTVAARPRMVTVEHEGEDLRVALPAHCPAADVMVTSTSGDLLFLIGRVQPDHDNETDYGVLLVGRRGEDGTYATLLWHETLLSFLSRSLW